MTLLEADRLIIGKCGREAGADWLRMYLICNTLFNPPLVSPYVIFFFFASFMAFQYSLKGTPHICITFGALEYLYWIPEKNACMIIIIGYR